MKKRAYTLTEVTAVMIIVGIVGATLLHVLKPNDIKRDMLDKSAKNMLVQLEYATRQLLARNSNNYSFTSIIGNDNSTFSITSSGADEKLIEVYKKNLMGLRKYSVPASYLSSSLIDKDGISSGYFISDFTQGFKVKNGTYFAIKLNGNCTTVETKIYNPILPNEHSVTNSCGLFFFDVNMEDAPNYLGVDQFIVSIGKYGIK